MSSFKVFHVAPEEPTNLADRTSIPLPGSDLDPELIVNSITIPRPFETDRLRTSLAKTLQLFPLHFETLKREVTGNAWSIRLTNRPVRLVVGVTDTPGPFSDQWMGETHSDYYEEIDRETMFSKRDTPLFLAKVTTWRETGQTALFVCIWHGLGDAFAVLHFLKTWSALYQGESPLGNPTFSKFFLPAPEILSTSSYRVGSNEAHFGFPLESGNMDWESTEKFVQVWNANPMKQTDGTWQEIPGASIFYFGFNQGMQPSFLKRCGKTWIVCRY